MLHRQWWGHQMKMMTVAMDWTLAASALSAAGAVPMHPKTTTKVS